MDVVEWAELHWLLPETGRPIVLADWQKEVLRLTFPDDPAEAPETVLISTVKKAGKTTLDALMTMWAALTFPAPETVFTVANDLAQAQERVFDLIAKQVRAQGLEGRNEAVVMRSEIYFPETGTKIAVLPADFAGAAGAIFGVSSWTELWAFRHEAHIRLWEELTPIPNRRSLRIVDSYAGFAGDSPILEPMWERALAGKRVHDELPIFRSGRLLAYIDSGEEAQERAWRGSDDEREAYYAEQRASLRAGTFNRLHFNVWQSGEEAFVTAEDWDACVNESLRPLRPGEKNLTLAVGLDIGTRSDCAAVVAVAKDGDGVRLCRHRIWTPRKGEPVDIRDLEAYILELARDFRVGVVKFDPMQADRSEMTLREKGVRMDRFSQGTTNLTLAGQNLFDLIRERRLVMYPDDELRQHALNSVAIESARGWRLAKEKASRKIDGLVALSFAALAAIEEGDKGTRQYCSTCGYFPCRCFEDEPALRHPLSESTKHLDEPSPWDEPDYSQVPARCYSSL